MIKRIVKMEFREAETDAFLKIFEESQPLIRAFPGCRHVELLRQKNNPAVMFTLSFWESEEALEHYRQSDLFRTTWTRTKTLFDGRPQAWTLEMVPSS